MDFIPYGRQFIDDDDINAVVSVLKSDFLTTGPMIENFEQKVCEFTGAKYGVAFSNATSCLHGAVYAAGTKEGDEIITSPITFAATANAILYNKAKPVFADIQKETKNIDVEEIKNLINKKTKAIIPVDFAGQPCDLEEIQEIAKDHNLVVIEDASHSLGASYKNKKVGTISDMTIFSFHPVKNITTGEGGMVLTNHSEYYEKLLLFRSHGITRNKGIMNKTSAADHYYEQLDLGYNYRLTDIQAALGISQLKKLPSFIKRRQEIVSSYHNKLKDYTNIGLPFIKEDRRSAWHLYVVEIENRDEIYHYLKSKNIGTNVHYIPVYQMPYYQNNGYQGTFCKNAEAYYKKALTLPLFYKMTNAQVDYVIQTLMEGIKKFKDVCHG